jgi:hypothetical protein
MRVEHQLVRTTIDHETGHITAAVRERFVKDDGTVHHEHIRTGTELQLGAADRAAVVAGHTFVSTVVAPAIAARLDAPDLAVVDGVARLDAVTAEQKAAAEAEAVRAEENATAALAAAESQRRVADAARAATRPAGAKVPAKAGAKAAPRS